MVRLRQRIDSGFVWRSQPATTPASVTGSSATQLTILVRTRPGDSGRTGHTQDVRRAPVAIAAICFALTLTAAPAFASGGLPGVPLPSLPGAPVPSNSAPVPAPLPTVPGVAPVPLPNPSLPVPLPSLPTALPTSLLPGSAPARATAPKAAGLSAAGVGSLGLPPPPYYTQAPPYDIRQVDWEADRAKWVWNDPHAHDVVVNDNAGNGQLLMPKQVHAFLAAQKKARQQAYASDHPQHGIPTAVLLLALALIGGSAVAVTRLRSRPEA
jgi:hypothetical protein